MKYIFGRAIDEYIALKTLSIKEIKYKLLSKGIKGNLIDNYIQNKREEIEEYEAKCAIKIANKKQYEMEKNDIKNFLKKKGYREESIYKALDENLDLNI